MVRRYSGGWKSAVGKAFACHNDPTVDLILRIQKMDITGSYHRLSQLFTQRQQSFGSDSGRSSMVLDSVLALPQHKLIVADGLDLQIIIKFHHLSSILIGGALQNSLDTTPLPRRPSR